MKQAEEIVKYGRVKKFDPKPYQFNSLDLETIDNELFLIGVINNNRYEYTLTKFYKFLNDFFVSCVQSNHDVLTWSRYDNTFIIKCLLKPFTATKTRETLIKVGKVSPLFSYRYGAFTIEISNIIKMCIVITIFDKYGHRKKLTIYNLKNLFADSDLETTAKDYRISYYSKMGEEYHLINRERFDTDKTYRENVITSNLLDNKVLIDIGNGLLDNFQTIAGILPKTIFTAGSLARSYLLTMKDVHFNFKAIYGRKKKETYDKLLDYTMRSYHGGKIESYILGYLPSAKIVDITSAYPDALSRLPKPTKEIIIDTDVTKIKNYFYVFINCVITIDDANLIHPISVPSPINTSNISPFGTFKAVITKPEYDYLLERGCVVEVIDYIAIVHEDVYPYKTMIELLFNKRMETKRDNPSLSGLYKVILNSLYGITYELTDVFEDGRDEPEWTGYRAGDFFNPIIASYITALTRTTLSRVSQNVLDNGGEVYLNMTDSIIYNGEITLDVFSEVKTLGKFEMPVTINNVMILGAGRYEYQKEFEEKYVIRSRGFSVKVKDKSFYQDLDLDDDKVFIQHKTFVTFFKATGEKYAVDKLGHLVTDDYEINPFNLGGKRIIVDRNVNLKKEYTLTTAVRMEILENE